MSEVEEFTHTVQRLRELTSGFEEFHQARQRAIRRGVFAYSPDPVVFGPDVLAYEDFAILDNPYLEYRECYYISTYRRIDYPDRNYL